MKILSGAEFAKIKARISELVGGALEDFILPAETGQEAEREKLAALHVQLEQIKPELIARLDRISPYFEEEYGDDWQIEKFKSTLDTLIAKSDALPGASGQAYQSCLKMLGALSEIFS